MSTNLQPSDFFMLRTPLLPSRTVLDWRPSEDQAGAPGPWVDGLKAKVADPAFREALRVASPAVAERVAPWLDSTGSDGHKLEDTLVKYLARASARATPFGLFAGVSVGEVAQRTELRLEPVPRRRVRLDFRRFAALTQRLSAQRGDSPSLRCWPNPTIAGVAGRLRYVEHCTTAGAELAGHRTAEVQESPALLAVLERARGGATRAQLVERLLGVEPELSEENARSFLDQLLEAQLLACELDPAVEGDEPLEGLVALLRRGGAAGPMLEALTRLQGGLRALDASPPGEGGEQYGEVRAALEALDPAAEGPDLHVDLLKPASTLTLGKRTLAPLTQALAAVSRFALHREDLELRRFTEAFTERYPDQFEVEMLPLSQRRGVPLLEALDDEAGLGFGGGGVGAEAGPLAGLELPDAPGTPEAPFGPAHQHLLRGWTAAVGAGQHEWVLDAADVEALARGQQLPFPDAVCVTASLLGTSGAAVDQGQGRWVLHSVQGPSGVSRMGRFCDGDEALTDRVREHLRQEEALRPDVVFAEVLHLPRGADANMVHRPRLRAFAIDCLGGGPPSPRCLPLDDLRLTLVNGALVLFSARLGREVAPRLTCSHNTTLSSLPVYRFLCALAHRRESKELGFTWGPLATAPFLPRVRLGEVVLSPARWNLGAPELAAFRAPGSEAHAVRTLHTTLRLPRWVGIADDDNVLPVDLDNPLMARQLATAARARPSLSLVELFLEADQLVTTAGEAAPFAHEFVIPFIKPGTPAQANLRPGPRPSPVATTAVQPCLHTPGSRWLYAKLYCGPANADALLTDGVLPLVRALQSTGDVERWFFIRYADPHWHLRLRFEGDPARLLTTVLPALHDAAEHWRAGGLLWKLQLDGYEPEVERYGGHAALPAVESIFQADSDAVLSMLSGVEAGALPDARWFFALRGAHQLLVDLGLDHGQREAVFTRARARFAAEHAVDQAFEQQLARRFRELRPRLEGLLDDGPEVDEALGAGRAALERRGVVVREAAASLTALARRGALRGSLEGLAPSLVHMACNRALRSHQRANELVLYDTLVRLYRSRRSRALAG
ncbi:MAG: lantibiotic dehydratase [Myxococcaceae bacterium]|nr:lantibiotic dehydratase [Myxococcaceae bacterium]